VDFIERCIQGFLSQRTSFNFEIIIHDDASDDNTSEIIKSYYENHKDKIVPIFQNENQWKQRGINPLWNYVIPKVRGKYIALCEGDDYWTDPYKLQKQVDFLESNSQCSAVVHKTAVLNYDGSLGNPNQFWRDFPDVEFISTIDLIHEITPFHTTSICMHISYLKLGFKEKKYRKILRSTFSVDLVIYFLISEYGKIGYINQYMSMYRLHKSSVTHDINHQNVFNFNNDRYNMWSNLMINTNEEVMHKIQKLIKGNYFY
jgi:glycosyltransferase involved in cell wall biosynthesis